MPWSDSPDYQRPIRLRDIAGVIGLLLVLLFAYELVPNGKPSRSSAAAAHAR